jgi:hypothetical protein
MNLLTALKIIKESNKVVNGLGIVEKETKLPLANFYGQLACETVKILEGQKPVEPIRKYVCMSAFKKICKLKLIRNNEKGEKKDFTNSSLKIYCYHSWYEMIKNKCVEAGGYVGVGDNTIYRVMMNIETIFGRFIIGSIELEKRNYQEPPARYDID